jgi:hypothetical protein
VVAIDDLSTGNLSNVAHLADEPLFEPVEGTVADTRLLQGASAAS